MQAKQINDIIQQILSSLPPGVKNLPDDVKNNLHAAMQGVFSKLDLVTREEFDTQSRVLQKTRQKLENLEKLVAELDKRQ